MRGMNKMGLPTDRFQCRVCGIKTTECDDEDITICKQCGEVDED